jgi:hypothetical protein
MEERVPHDWTPLVNAADEWLVSFSLPYMRLHDVRVFALGRALELYLKAAQARLMGSLEAGAAFGPDLPAIWLGCKSLDPSFLSAYDLRPAVLHHDLLNPSDFAGLGKDDLVHFLQNQELYLLLRYHAEHVASGSLKRDPGASFPTGGYIPGPAWSALFGALRLYLGHPAAGEADEIVENLAQSKLPAFSVTFLRGIVGQPARAGA